MFVGGNVRLGYWEVAEFDTYIVKVMFSQKARCGSVGASWAGKPEEGGSSRVGGKVCLLVEM